VENGNQEGTLPENITQAAIQEAIFDNIHCNQFFLAEAAPICAGSLHGQYGYNAERRTANSILSGTYEYPPDFDLAMQEICKECACIRCMIPKDSLCTDISKEDWRLLWKGHQESTSYLELGLQFDHYIAFCSSDHILYFHPLKAMLIF
jgi:hypothetical protein